MMISEDMYNRISAVLRQEDVRLENNVILCQNYIIRYRPSDPVPYINLIKAQAERDYFDTYIHSLLPWLNKFVESG